MNVKELCRTCLTSGNEIMCSLFNENLPESGPTAHYAADLLKTFTSVKIDRNDNFPDRICLTCLNEIRRAHSFKIKCERSDLILHQLIGVNIIVKNVKQTINSESNIKLNSDLEVVVKSVEIETFRGHDQITNNKTDDQTLANLLSQEEYLSDFQVTIKQEAELEIDDDVGKSGEIVDIDGDSDLIKEDSNNDQIMSNTLYTKEMTIKEEPELDIDENIDIDWNDSEFKNANELKCTACTKEFQSLDSFRDHILSGHIEGNLCKLCNEEFQCSDVEHSVKHTRPSFLTDCTNEDNYNSSKKDSTEFSGRRYHTDENALEHLSYPNGKSNFGKYLTSSSLKLPRNRRRIRYCALCPALLPNRQDLISHMEKIHNCKKPFECFLCRKKFTRKNSLWSHLRAAHRKEIPTVDVFYSEINSKIEQFAVNNDNDTRKDWTPLQCELCSKKFLFNETLRNHLTNHIETKHGKTENKCEICSRIFTFKHNLLSHMSVHSDEHNLIGKTEYKCEICSRTFSWKHNLLDHMRVHSDDKPFQCNFCTEKFKHPNSLKSHIRLKHLNDLKCSICLRIFGSNYHLIRHMRTHTGEKPYKCGICSKTFRQNQNLSSHLHFNHTVNFVRVDY